MDRKGFELMVLTAEEDYPDETAWLNRLFREGLGTLHLRKPGWSAERLLSYLAKVEEQFHERVVLHGDPAIVERIKLKGIHYPLVKLPTHKPGYSLSCSTHSWQELQEISGKVDYAFISPFFDSFSKRGYKANRDLKAIPEGVDKSKAVALGGIHAANIREVKALGLKGGAVLGTIWQTEDPLAAYRKLKEQTAE